MNYYIAYLKEFFNNDEEEAYVKTDKDEKALEEIFNDYLLCRSDYEDSEGGIGEDEDGCANWRVEKIVKVKDMDDYDLDMSDFEDLSFYRTLWHAN